MSDTDILTEDESLFTSPGILSIEYLPRLLPYRENQQKYLADCIKRLPKITTNIMINGPSGIGKTASVRWVFREMSESHVSDILPIYINCWKDDDMAKIILRICNQLSIGTSYKGIDELTSLVFRRLKSATAVAFAFDEIDRIKNQLFLYNFIDEIPNKTIFLISTKRDWYVNLDERIRSRLVPEMIEFEKYSREQTSDILVERKKHAFVPGVWDNDAFSIIVDKSHTAGNIRTGLALLKSSGLEAENEGSKMIKKEHVSKAIEKLGLIPVEEEKERKLTDF